MPFMRWDDFRQNHPRAHLIDAELTAANGGEAKEAPGLLRRLVARLGVRGDYAISEEEGLIHLAIETDYDRDRLRTRFGAKSLPSADAWVSRASFRFAPEKWREGLAGLEPTVA
jgi:hypothetical protein